MILSVGATRALWYRHVDIPHVVCMCMSLDLNSTLWWTVYNLDSSLDVDCVKEWLIIPSCKTSVCVKLMYILFFFFSFFFFHPNEQKNCKLCTRINNCDYASSRSWHRFCGVQIIFESAWPHTGEASLIFNFEGKNVCKDHQRRLVHGGRAGCSSSSFSEARMRSRCKNRTAGGNKLLLNHSMIKKMISRSFLGNKPLMKMLVPADQGWKERRQRRAGSLTPV